ncbi:MAG: sulfur oxidation c-type cytochrome SoxA [Gammaproteobacteria bacterium]
MGRTSWSSRFERLRRLCGAGLAVTVLAGAAPATTLPDAAADRAALRAAYAERFPELALDDYALGVYAIDPGLRAQWEELNEFPPYAFAIDEGRELFETALPDGSRLGDCLPDGGLKTAHTYPRIDAARGEAVTLPLLVNECRIRHGASAWDPDRGPMMALLAYLADSSRGERLAVPLPATPAALAVYARGRALFHTKRGQRNFACFDCHVTAVGRHLREQPLMPVLGALTHYPVYGLRWGAMGSLHARFAGCYEQVGAASPPAQSPDYRALEYFLGVMGDGLPFIAPGVHR